jgi:hypothetical protein
MPKTIGTGLRVEPLENVGPCRIRARRMKSLSSVRPGTPDSGPVGTLNHGLACPSLCFAALTPGRYSIYWGVYGEYIQYTSADNNRVITGNRFIVVARSTPFVWLTRFSISAFPKLVKSSGSVSCYPPDVSDRLRPKKNNKRLPRGNGVLFCLLAAPAYHFHSIFII